MRAEEVQDLFSQEYGHPPRVGASAPGVMQLLGEQVEFARGHVLGIALPQRCQVALSPRDDHNVNIHTTLGNERKRFTLSTLKFRKEDRWANLVKGVVSGLDNLGCPMSGLDILICSDIPVQRGLGSSSALCLALVRGLCELHGFTISTAQAIYVAYTAETQFMGKPCRLSSCYIAMHANSGAVFSLDMRSLEFRNLRFFNPAYHFYYCDSTVPLNGAMDDYAEREALYAGLRGYLRESCGKRDVRDIEKADLKDAVSSLPEEKRRICLHAWSEEDRVHQATDVLESGQIQFLGKILQRSHESLRDQYDVSCPEIDWLVKHGQQDAGARGGRLSGPGLGGGVCLLMEGPVQALDQAVDALGLEYERIFGFRLRYFRAVPSQGARIEKARK